MRDRETRRRRPMMCAAFPPALYYMHAPSLSCLLKRCYSGMTAPFLLLLIPPSPSCTVFSLLFLDGGPSSLGRPVATLAYPSPGDRRRRRVGLTASYVHRVQSTMCTL